MSLLLFLLFFFCLLLLHFHTHHPSSIKTSKICVVVSSGGVHSGRYTMLASKLSSRRTFNANILYSLKYLSSETTTTTVEIPQLSAVIRTTDGSKLMRKLRSEGFIPGVIYGVDDDRNVVKINIAYPTKTIEKELRSRKASIENTLYELVLPNEIKHRGTLRQIQFDPITDAPLSVNFLIHHPENRMRIPLNFINKDQSVDLKRDCFLVHVNNFIECICDGEIPAYISVDLSGRQKGDILRLGALSFPPGVRPAKSVPSDFVVAVIKTASN